MPSPSFFDAIALLPWIEAATIFFAFAWGAMLGSFINVVVHRVPMGASVVTTPSRCPTCGTSIRPWHNVPVFGWIMLGGRCHDCHEPIAATYPIVEAGCGALVMLLAIAELVCGGRWLASSLGEHPTGIDRLLWGDWSLLATCGLHSVIAVTIVAWSLLDQVPWRLAPNVFTVAAATAVLAVTFIPTARPPAIWTGIDIDFPTTIDAMARAVVGIAAGAVLGRAARGQGVRWGLPLIGTVLGWQGATLVAIVTAVTARACRGRIRSRALPGLIVAVSGALAMAFAGSTLARLVGS